MPTEERIEEVKQTLFGCVQRGVEFLNKEYPDWRTQIDWGIFEFLSMSKCIAGQLGFYWNIGLEDRLNLGFDVSGKMQDEFYKTGDFCPYAYLHDTWLQMRDV